MSIDIEGNERRVLYEFARDEVRAHGARRVLDLACAEGEGTAVIAAGVPQASVLGVDLNAEAIRKAQGRFAKNNLRFERGNALSLPYADHAFDAIVSCHTIEHFNATDQQKFLGELRRLLEPNGLLVIATPDRDVWSMLGIASQQEDHIRELTQTEFIELVRLAGFFVRRVFGQSILRQGSFPLRRMLNLLKYFDVLKIRRLLGRSVRTIDKKAQPIVRDATVMPLISGEKASTTVILAEYLRE